MSSWLTRNHIRPMSKDAYVSVVLKGGLGNQIFQVLAAQKFAEVTGRTLVVNGAPEIFNIPSVPEGLLWVTIKEEPYMWYQYQQDIFNKHRGQNVMLDGYWQNDKYFPRQMPQLNVIKNNKFFLHFRFTDYHNTIHDVGLIHYYRKCLTKVLRDFPSVNILVFTDDEVEATMYIEALGIPFNYTFSTTNAAIDVLKEMAACTGGICANSSLSWLGAFFQKGRGDIYMPSKWINGLKSVDIYPSWAKIIDVNPPR